MSLDLFNAFILRDHATRIATTFYNAPPETRTQTPVTRLLAVFKTVPLPIRVRGAVNEEEEI